MTTATNPATNPNLPPAPATFGWKQLLIRAIILFIVTGFISYLGVAEIINMNHLNSQLLEPAVTGLVIAILNWRYLYKIAIIVMPLWLPAALAISLAAIYLTAFIPYEEGSNIFIDWGLKILPFFIAGHWIYNGYSRLARRNSLLVYLAVVIWFTLIGVIIFESDSSHFFWLEAIDLSITGVLLSTLHFGHPKGLPKKN